MHGQQNIKRYVKNLESKFEETGFVRIISKVLLDANTVKTFEIV